MIKGLEPGWWNYRPNMDSDWPGLSIEEMDKEDGHTDTEDSKNPFNSSFGKSLFSKDGEIIEIEGRKYRLTEIKS